MKANDGVSVLSPAGAEDTFWDEKRCRGEFVFVTGGARSGKSRFAEELASGLGSRVAYVATAAVGDAEMAERIRKHRDRRPPDWATFEEELDVAGVILREGGRYHVILVDCLTLLVSNILGRTMDEKGKAGARRETETAEGAVLEQCRRLVEAAGSVPAHVLVVSNEVGLGLVPANRMGRVFRDVLGRANQTLAAAADRVYVLWSGIPLQLKG